MTSLALFPQEKIVGVFRGFQEGGLEFHANLVLPYRPEFQRIPMHGQFLLVQLETPDEAVLGRIASFSSEGKLSQEVGEEFNLRAVREGREVPDDLREQYLKYRVNIRVLGVLRRTKGKLSFVASQRRLPHVGSPVALPSDEVLQEIAGHNISGVPIGHFALGEYVYAQGSSLVKSESWMQQLAPEVLTKFDIRSLVSRRSFIFARAGFGKSNLNKLLFSRLYATTPTVEKRGGRQVPVGTIIFDPDGEYFWPDDKGRPGLCDVPELEDKVVVFTSRKAPNAFYRSFIAGGIRLDIRDLRPADVIAIAVNPDRQEQQNVRKLAQLSRERWRDLVDLISKQKFEASLAEISKIMGLEAKGQQEVEAIAARSNMTTIVSTLHDSSSVVMKMLLDALSEGKLCVFDLSQLRGGTALILSGLILRKIFDHNQQEFTAAESRTIPTIAVIEEAQSVLKENSSAAEPYIAWVKEGRKYDLGAVLVTQQPGSIPDEILSQGDNWFIFHLLSAHDLSHVQRANAHFSQDILSVLLNEPIPGHGVFWSSVDGKPYPVSLRVLSFEELYKARDPEDCTEAAQTFALDLIERYRRKADALRQVLAETYTGDLARVLIADGENGITNDGTFDPRATFDELCRRTFLSNNYLQEQLAGEEGVRWFDIIRTLEEVTTLRGIESPYESKHQLVRSVLNNVLGPQSTKWEMYRLPTSDDSKGTLYARRIVKETLHARRVTK
ncbi:MAG: DUF87 domain-containing protein [Chloroflexota bacterium]|nr:DUF87 domain-containing protein [Chloroflexota bacterium]